MSSDWIAGATIITALSTTIAAGVAAYSARGIWRSYRLQERKEKIDIKKDVLRRIVGNRFYLTQVDKMSVMGEPFVALNEACVVFSDDLEAMKSLRAFDEAKPPEKITVYFPKLIESLSAAAEVDGFELGGYFIDHPFAPPSALKNNHCPQNSHQLGCGDSSKPKPNNIGDKDSASRLNNRPN